MIIHEVYQQQLHIQKEPFACGPVAVLNALQRFEDTALTEEEIVDICKPEPVPIGCQNEDIVRTCKHVGLEVTEEKVNATIQDIEEQIDRGDKVIVNYFNVTSNLGHYSVIDSYDEEALYFFDSILGLLRLRKDDFL
ncbi:MAG: C39 family peptidase [Candidatus Peribacteria bacterium]|nr:MAG: C39 family peptidase [Candidatus Peribacteria bacterium]